MRVCNFLLVINSNIGPALQHFRDVADFATTRLYSVQILGMFLLDKIADLGAPKCEDYNNYFRRNPTYMTTIP